VKKTLLHPGRIPPTGGLVGLIPAVKQSRHRRGPAVRQPGGFRGSGFLIQVSKYLVDHRRVFDAGNDADITAAFTASFNVDVEYTLESLRPAY
jgi:hypothetical protein